MPLARTTQVLAAFFLAVAFGTAHAETPTPKQPTAQQQRMKNCNMQATGKTGDERKQFMSICLKGESPSAKSVNSQQSKMKDCNAKAGDKKGDGRKVFMSACLKG